MNTPMLRRPLTRNTTRTPRLVPRGRSEPLLCDTPCAPHPRAHGVSGFGVGAFGEISVGYSELYNLVTQVQAASYVAYHGDKTPRGGHAAPANSALVGVDYAGGKCAAYHRTVYRFISSGDSESPVTDFRTRTNTNPARMRCARGQTLRWFRTLKPTKTTTSQIQIKARAPLHRVGALAVSRTRQGLLFLRFRANSPLWGFKRITIRDT